MLLAVTIVCVVVLVVVAAGAGVGLVMAALIRVLGELSRRDSWQKTAFQLGLSTDAPYTRMTGTAGLVEIELNRTDQGPRLRHQLTIRGLPRDLALVSRADDSWRVGIGDAAFDRLISVGTPHTRMLCVLTPRNRELATKLAPYSLQIRGGKLTLTTTWLRVAELHSAIELARDLSDRRSEPSVDLPRRCRTEPDPEVRRTLLTELLKSSDPDQDLIREALTWEDAPSRLLAATHLGEREVLGALADDPDAPLSVRLDATLALEDPEHQGVLVEALRRGPHPRALEALARFGSIETVQALHALGTHAALAAARRIQERTGGVRGGLALVTPAEEEGQLSATAAAGQLAVTREGQ